MMQISAISTFDENAPAKQSTPLIKDLSLTRPRSLCGGGGGLGEWISDAYVSFSQKSKVFKAF